MSFAPAKSPRGKVIDLMDALRQSLDKRGARQDLAKESRRAEVNQRQLKPARGGKG